MQEEGNTAEITIGNPAPVVDPATGTIWLPFCRNNDRVFMTSSTDDGRTWSERVEITSDVKLDDWGWYATGPCHATVLKRGEHAGRILITCDHRSGSGWGPHVIYSDDHGTTWELGGIVCPVDNMGPNECVAVEMVDGRVYLNARNQAGGQHRIIAYSSDGGESFTAPAMDEQLVEPTFQASVLCAKATDEGDRLRFFMDDGDDNAGVYSSSSLNDGEWHHVAGVRDRAEGELRVYLDGALENSVEDTTDSSLANANPVVVGGFNNGARYFTGDMDFVRISDKALTSDQFVPTDHDGDGMATTWEVDNGLEPNDDGSVDFDNGPEGDRDGDGITNYEEYIADTNPENSDSYLRMEGIRNGAEGMEVIFASSSKRFYDLYSQTSPISGT